LSDIAYVNGQFLPLAQATINVQDRGFMFADSVYEVTGVIDGLMVENPAHLTRLQRSLDAISIPLPMPLEEIGEIQRQVALRSGLKEGLIYLQVTRGIAPRDFFIKGKMTPSVVCYVTHLDLLNAEVVARGAKVITVDDIRWKHRDIKSNGVLATVLSKMKVSEAGADEAWLVLDGHVSEAGTANAFIVTHDGAIVTRPLSNWILPGVTRNSVVQLAAEYQLRIEERLFTPGEALAAREAFNSSSTSFVTGVVEIDGKPIADGKVGALSKRLREIYLEHVRKTGIPIDPAWTKEAREAAVAYAAVG
jgi:D-alanine transaminase